MFWLDFYYLFAVYFGSLLNSIVPVFMYTYYALAVIPLSLCSVFWKPVEQHRPCVHVHILCFGCDSTYEEIPLVEKVDY